MSNVASFESFDTDQQIAVHQAGLVRVVLEGETDVTLFSRFWFPSFQETFQFVEAGKLAPGAGCTGVADAVAYSQSEGVPAIGIMDRDTLFRSKNWPILFSTDPMIMNANWTETSIYVTSMWEVEAYLLEPDLLAEWVAVAHRTPPGSIADCDRALNRSIEACKVLLAAAPYFAAQHEIGVASPNGLFSDQPLERVVEVCDERIATATPEAKAVASAVKALVDAILANEPAEQAEQLRFLLRYVDTKRLLSRLLHTLQVREKAHWVLAGFMLKSGRKPSELEQLLKTVEAGLPA
jgi:hypothetical protein